MSGSLVDQDAALGVMLTELDLSVSRTAVSRRDGGGLDEREAMEAHGTAREAQRTDNSARNSWSGLHRNANASRTSGTFDGRSESAYGQANTVISSVEENDVPLSVSVSSFSPSIKRYKLYRVPVEDDGFEETCFKLIGHGSTFCTRKFCSISHQGAVVRIQPGLLFVAKTASTAFSEPHMSHADLTPELLVEWNNKAAPLEHWTRLFLLASAVNQDGPASAAAMEAQNDFAQRAEAFRTPGRKKRKAFDAAISPMALHVSPYKRQFDENEDDPKNDEGVKTEESGINSDLLEKLRKLDQGLEHASKSLVDLYSEYNQHTRDSDMSSRALEHKCEKISHDVGTRPRALGADYNAPTAWGSIGALGLKIDQVSEEFSPGKVAVEISNAIGDMKGLVSDQVSRQTLALDSRLSKIKNFALQSSMKLNGRIDAEMDAWTFGKKPEADATPDWSSEAIKAFEVRLEDMSSRLSKVTAETDETSIRFAGLGFRSSREANAWLMIHLPDHPCGLIVDVHIVMEHVSASLSSNEIISRLEKQVKLKVPTLADGLAMSSFQNAVPRFFSKAGAHKVIKNDDSYFNEIASFEEWDTPITGYRDLLKEELATFRESHQRNIDDTLERQSIICSIATMALTESCAWMEGLIVFIDDYHRDLGKARFGTKKSWHVTTRLARRMFVEVATYRNGVQNAFQTGKNVQVCQRIVWAVLKSHDIMARYRRHNFKDDPSVSSELVKFLAINTGFEVLEVLAVKVADMSKSVTAMTKEVQTAVKTASTASNKADENKKLYDQLLKRVTKIEK
jgi:uncharacterized protein YoxC